MAYNVKVINFTTMGINGNGNVQAIVLNNEVTAGVSCTLGIDVGNNSVAWGNFVHDNQCSGISSQAVADIKFNLITNNTGSTTDGIQVFGTFRIDLSNNTIFGNERHGINYGQPYLASGVIARNNLIVGNGGYGFVGGDAAGSAAFPQFDGNTYFSNTLGDRRFMDDTGVVNPIDGAAPYTNVLDVFLSSTPFTNAAGGDFTLNNVAGGGAAARASGNPGTLPGVGGIGYIDMGALQHQDSGGGGGSTPNAGAYVQ
jgi:hypothetical protein